MSKPTTFDLSNDYLSLTLGLHASEWTSLVDRRTGLEYAWSGDPAWWEGRNPTLFPFVGKLNGGVFRYRGRSYPHGNHGFARRAVFALSRLSEEMAELQLTDSPETRAVYPWAFSLTNRYQLRGNFLDVTISVRNRDTKLMPCTLGAHPAFACPLAAGEDFRDYRLVFPDAQQLRRRLMHPDGSWDTDLTDFGTRQEIPISPELFADDVLAFWGVRARQITLQGPREYERVTLHRGNSDQLGIWTKPGAPFVCLEPWRGFGDLAGWHGEVLNRPETFILHQGEVVELHYSLEIGLPVTD